MQNFITLGQPRLGGKIKVHPQNISYWVLKGGSFGNSGPHAKFQNPRTTPSGRNVEFTPKYIIVGGEGGVSEMFLSV